MRFLEPVARCFFIVVAASAAAAAPPVTVPVGAPGNPADATGYGAVNYHYRIGKFEVSNAEYRAFLNAAAKADPHELYDGRMAGEYGGITRTGAPGGYRYANKAGTEDKPVSYVTWESCARYCNWLSNGGGAGDTEDGTYTIGGGRVEPQKHSRLAKRDALSWAIASEDEWYKAAYYDPQKDGTGGYWNYACKGGAAPQCNLNSNVITDAGAFGTSPSAYGTFDQNGNVWEYNETQSGGKVGLRGGSFYLNDTDTYLRASTRYEVLSAKWPNYGFRVVALGAGKAEAKPERGGVPQPVPPPQPAVRTGGSKTFYVSQSGGNDNATGESPAAPWKTLARASTDYLPGDTLLLKRGDRWNEELAPRGEGTPQQPITIGAYGEGDKPLIDREDFRQDRTGIRLSDQGGFKIVGIEFARCMTGIFADYADGCPTKRYIWVEDCYFHDSLLYQHYEDYPKRKIGLGICFFSYECDNQVVLRDITIKDCVFRRLASGIWTNSPDNFNKNASYIYNFANLTMEGCLFEEGYQWQQGIRGVAGGAMRRCVTHDVGRGFRSFNGVAGSMFFRCKDWVFEDSEWGYVSIGLGSGDGEAFDFEGNCDRMTMRRCLFHDTDGPGFLLCCYASDGHAHSGIVMENCVINAKSKRPIGLPRCAIINTTDWNESLWRGCRFYLSPGEALMRVMDPEKDKKTKFVDCEVQDLSAAGGLPDLARAASAKASSEQVGKPAGNLNDGDAASAWAGKGSADEWVQLVFPSEQTIGELRIREDPSSSISRYVIEYADAKSKQWVACFNGAEIGDDFIAPIVSRETRGVRLRVLATKDGGRPSIREFAAYAGGGRPFDDPDGTAAGKLVGK